MNKEPSICKTINIGSGYEISIKDLIKVITDQIGRKINVLTDSKRVRPDRSEVNRLCCSNKLAKNILNWEPSFKGKFGLVKGIKSTLKWYSVKENLKNFFNVITAITRATKSLL